MLNLQVQVHSNAPRVLSWLGTLSEKANRGTNSLCVVFSPIMQARCTAASRGSTYLSGVVGSSCLAPPSSCPSAHQSASAVEAALWPHN